MINNPYIVSQYFNNIYQIYLSKIIFYISLKKISSLSLSLSNNPPFENIYIYIYKQIFIAINIFLVIYIYIKYKKKKNNLGLPKNFIVVATFNYT